MSPSFTHCWNWGRVGAGSDPLQPPMAMTALPLASSRPAALWSPTVAAAQRVLVDASSAATALLGVAPPLPGVLCAVPPGAVPPGAVRVPPNGPRASAPPAPAWVALAGPADGIE